MIEIITWSAIPAIFLQFLGVIIAECCFNQNIDFEVLGILLNNRAESIETKAAYNILKNSLPQILVYHLILITFGMFFGFFFRKIIRYFKWDRKYRFFRFSNKWYYIFSGECLDFPDVNGSYEEIGVKIVNLLCDIGSGESVIYSGYFSDYYLDGQGKLESIQISEPYRRFLSKDNKQKNRFYDIPSRYLLIPAETIVNINMLYLKLKEA